jgi:hypothetical protein
MKKMAVLMLMTFTASTIYANSPQKPEANKQQNLEASAEQISIKLRPEIVGLWGMQFEKKNKCIEYYNFKSNNEVVVKSGKEWSTGVYDYQRSPEMMTKNLSALTMQIQFDNNEVDCSGIQVDQTGEVTQYIVKWKDPRTVDLCNNENSNECFATLRRVLP